jgi:hypothetical protein
LAAFLTGFAAFRVSGLCRTCVEAARRRCR